MSCTLLWAAVHLEWPQKQRELWVQRSGTRELDIHAHRLRTSSTGWSADNPGDIFKRFPKWRSLCFSDASASIITEALRAVPSTVGCQSLQSVDIRTVTNSSIGIAEASKLDGRLWGKLMLGAEGNVFPNLRNITLWNTPYSPWGMLENVATLDINLSDYTWNYWCQLLQQTKALEKLFLGAEWRWNRPADAYHGTPVVLSHLRSLELRKNDAMFLKSFLRDVTAPSLDNFTIWLPTKYDMANLTWENITQALSEFVSSFGLTLNSCIYRAFYLAASFTSHIQVDFAGRVHWHSPNFHLTKGFPFPWRSSPPPSPTNCRIRRRISL